MAKKSREEIDHYTLDQYEQEKHLGIGHEMTKNLGHDWRESEIEQNPAGKLMNYDSADTTRVINEPRSQGVYGKFRDPKDGTSTSENLSLWSDYARSNSYTGHDHKAGPGVAPTMPDPRERSAAGYRPGSGKDSDNYLLRPEWDRYEYGADSGPGRLQKSGKQ